MLLLGVLIAAGGLAVGVTLTVYLTADRTAARQNPTPNQQTRHPPERRQTEPAPSVQPRRLWPSSSSASSTHIGNYQYPPSQAFDGARTTCWAPGGRGSDIGEWVEGRLSTPAQLSRIVVIPGYDKIHPRAGDLFYLNGHVRRFRLVFGDGTTRSVEAGRDQRQVEISSLRVTTSTVRLIIDDMWAGTRWPGVNVSEIELYGTEAP